jgi:hypothetical protein
MQILKGHTSKETAYIVNDYPYGFRLRCKIRHWLEHHPKKGTRFFSQTTNPKRPVETWNTPKASTFQYVAGCMFINEEGHVTWTALNEYNSLEDCRLWFERYQEGLTPAVIRRVKDWIWRKDLYEKTKMGCAPGPSKPLPETEV